VFARETGIPYEAARKQQQRNCIGVRHWPAVIEACRRLGIKGVTAEVMLAGLCSRTAADDEKPVGNVDAAKAA